MPQRTNNRSEVSPAWLLERLEPRALLSDAPLPTLADLENPSDTVARIETSLGVVDVELFDGASPAGVSSFLTRIARGDIDPSFFHRLVPGRTLETGAYKRDDQAGVFQIPEPGPIAVETARSNVARTIALDGAGESGSSGVRYFFNLGDNSADFDGSRTVIGRVVNDASWAVVQRIAGLGTADLDVRLTGSEGSAFDAVPVIVTGTGGHGNGHDDDHSNGHHDDDHGDGHHGDDGTQTSVVDVVNVEVVKAAGRGEFYTSTVMYAEGFSGSTVDEFVPIANPNDADAAYQVILRFEKDPAHPFSRRDAVIATGTIAPNARGGVDVWHGATDFPGLPDAIITAGRPYAIEVRSTVPLSANLSHYDFGTATGESFVSQGETNWVIVGGTKGNSFDFLVWHNPTGYDATLVVTFIPEGGEPLAPIVVTTEAYRRGGINVSLLDSLPAGRFAARIMSDQPLVAALSHYHPGAAPEGSSSLGTGGRPSAVGVVPLATFGPTADDTVTLSFLAGGQEDDDGRITICHIPPGNPDNAHTIRVGISALRAHLAHGDHVGPCDGDGGEHGDGHHDDDDDGHGDGHDDDDDDDGEHTPSVIDVSLDFENPDLADISLPGALTLQPGHSGSVRLDSSVLDISAYLGQRFTVRWTASRPVFGGMSQTDAFDGVSTAVAVAGATRLNFAEGFMDPARAGTEVFETVAVYNPSAQDAAVSLVVRYTDGFVLSIDRTAAGTHTLLIDLHTLEEIRQQGLENHRYFYSMQVVADRPVAAQLSHLDTNLGRPGNAAGGFSTLGAPVGELTRLDCL